MRNEVTFAYYDFMIESVTEDRKIMEYTIGTKAVKHFLVESGEEEQIPVYEAGIVESLLKFIKKIFEGVINFFKKLLGFLSKDETFKPKKILIAAVQQKIKMMTAEERDAFILKDSYLSDAIAESRETILDASVNVEKDLKIIMSDFDNILARVVTNTERLENIKSDVAEHESNLAKEANVEFIRSKATDVKFDSIGKILKEYENCKEALKTFKAHSNNTQKTMNEYKKKIDKAMKFDIIGNAFFDYLPAYKDTIYTATAFITKSMKSVLDLMVYDYQSQENILKEFINFNK